jgi:sulfoxide reductase heme-binding subunit YedZ
MVLTASARRRSHLSGRERRIRLVAKPAVFVVCLLPLAALVAQAVSGGLGANPIETVNRALGDWALRFLLVALAVTPARKILGLPVLARFRRMLGLFAFFYVSLHLTSYVALDQFFEWREIWADVVKRRYITFGMAAVLLLVPLAVTSTKGWMKRIGVSTWQRLHQLVYPAAVLATVHFFMMVKADVREPAIYAVILMLLLGYRVGTSLRGRVMRSTGRTAGTQAA